MVYNIDSEQLINATQILLEGKEYKKLYKVFFDLIYNTIIDIGVKLNIRKRDTNERIYEYMTKIDNFIFNNLKIELFQKDLIQEVVYFYGIRKEIYKKEDIFLEERDVERLIKTYYNIKKIKIPDVNADMEDLEKNGLSTSQSYNSFNFLFSSEPSKRKNIEIGEVLDDMYRKSIQRERKEIKREYREGKISFEKGFNELASLRAKEGLLNTKGKRNRKVKITGKLHDNLDYKLYTRHLYGFLMLSISLYAIFYLGFLIFEYYKFPELGMSIFPHILFPIIVSLIGFYTYYKYFWEL